MSLSTTRQKNDLKIIKNFNYIKKEIYDIIRAIQDDISDTIILDSHDEFSKSMLEFIKVDPQWFKSFFELVISELKKGATRNTLMDEILLESNKSGRQLVSHVMDIIFGEDTNGDYEKEFINGKEEINEIEDHDTINDVKIEEAINNFKWRKNQLLAIANTINQNFSCGVHNQIMGSGKTFIILKTIWEHYKLNSTNKKLYIITCSRQEILKDLFFDEDGDIDDVKCELFKINDIIDLSKFHIINRVHKKNKNITLSEIKPSILIVNTDFLKSIDRANSIIYNDVNFIIFDECHSVSAFRLHELLNKIKYDYKISIIGFSATPLRKGADQKLMDIFSRTMDENDTNKRLNIISSYDIINSIRDGITLPPYYKLCEITETINGKVGKSNKDITKRILTDTLRDAPYKKILGWCKTKERLKVYYKFIKENFPNLSIYCSTCFDTELGALGYNTDWNEFTRKKGDCMLLCINRGREGCDIKNLDIVIYLDDVKDRSLLVSLQTAGRVLRIDKESKKTHGIIIDTFVNVDGIQIEEMTAKRIITYYKQIFSLSDETEHANQIDAYEQMINMCSNMEYDNVKEEITIKIDDNDAHDMKFKLELTTKIYDFNKMKIEMATIIDRMNHIDKIQKFNMIINKIKNCNVMTINTINFWETYDNIADKTKMGLPATSVELYNEYDEFFNTKTWYDILGLDTKEWYTTIEECSCALRKIYANGEITNIIYKELVTRDKRIPYDPIEFYKLLGFKSIKENFNKNTKMKNMT